MSGAASRPSSNDLATGQNCPVEPVTITLTTTDKIRAYINSANGRRRHSPTGANAMSEAEALAAKGRRKDGRWKRGSLGKGEIPHNRYETWRDAMQQAGIVIDHAPHLADQVIGGTITLNDAATHETPLLEVMAGGPMARGL